MNTTVLVGTGANNGNCREDVGGTFMSAPMISSARRIRMLLARRSDRTTAEMMNIIKLANSGANGETSQLYGDIVVQKTNKRNARNMPSIADYTGALPR